jgi:hypothetical protein
MQSHRRVLFIGGPFDGHCQFVALAPAELIDVAMLPVSRSTYRLLAGKPSHAQSPVTSVAEYHLDLSRQQCRYRFVRALAPCADADQHRPA